MSAELQLWLEAAAGAFRLSVPPLRLRGLTALVGPNGAGKTTLLRSLLGDLEPTAGRIALGESVLFDAERRVDVPLERRRLGYVSQHPLLFPDLDVLDNVAFGLQGPQRRERAEGLLATFGLERLARRPPDGLSGGERQKIALARALAPGPRALLLDEPFAALDADAHQELRRWLSDWLRTAGLPVLLVTHDANDVRALGAPILALEGGRVVLHGSPAPATPFLRALFG